MPRTAADAAAFRAKVLADPLYVGNSSTPPARPPASSLREPSATRSSSPAIWRGEVRDAVASGGPAGRFAITGVQTLKVNGAKLMEQDLLRFVPLSLAFVVVVLIFEFRTKRGVLLPLACVVAGTVWTTGVMVLCGSDINMGTLILPPLLMAIGIAYAIHVLSRYYVELVAAGRARWWRP